MESYSEWVYTRMCARKRPYKTPTQAVRGLSTAQRLDPGNHFTIYQCRFCGLWHVGRSKPKPYRDGGEAL